MIDYRKYKIRSVAVSIGIVLGIAFTLLQTTRASSQPGVPYSAEFLQRRVNPDGTERYRFERTIARQANGSRAEIERRHYRSQGKDVMLPTIHVWDTKSRQLTAVYPEVRAKITTALTDAAISQLSMQADSDCVVSGFQTIATDTQNTIAGIPVFLRERKIPASGRQPETRIREWVAPSYDCLVVKKTQQWFESGNLLPGEVTMDLVRLTPGEPPSEAFVIPAGLQEMSPSQVITAQNAVQGRECTECDRKAMENGDRFYYSNRAK
jgi:hypothetical protein